MNGNKLKKWRVGYAKRLEITILQDILFDDFVLHVDFGGFGDSLGDDFWERVKSDLSNMQFTDSKGRDLKLYHDQDNLAENGFWFSDPYEIDIEKRKGFCHVQLQDQTKKGDVIYLYYEKRSEP